MSRACDCSIGIDYRSNRDATKIDASRFVDIVQETDVVTTTFTSVFLV